MLAQIGFAIVLLPLLGSLLCWLAAPRWGEKTGMLLTTGSVITAAGLAWLAVALTFPEDGQVAEGILYTWLSTPSLYVSFGVLMDKLTATMMMVVTTVSACVHVYSFGYMSHDNAKPRFFAYLSFFTFAMLVLVSAPNLLQMFMGWEGVGLASYLLIGFWFKKKSANAAAMKAFIVNRIADLGLLLGILTTFWVVGSLNYLDIFAALGTLEGQGFVFFGTEIPALSLMAFFFLIGAMGKSAQIGFHTWLPDAMEGPTPVSALIHAATMVTAGVFLLARLSPLYELSGQVLTLLAWVGAITALFAATIGLTQTDIKRVIAYSTCSQLGYMFFACGVGAYGAAIFHLTTHAFFKALLFLGAGSVIHAMHDEQDMFKMGGLKKMLPITHGLMWIGSLALMGVPPFAGFFSKDLILESAWAAHSFTGQSLYVIGTAAAFLTAFYSMRVLYLTFYGQPRTSAKKLEAAHESPLVMLAPMYLLGLGAVAAGFVFADMGHAQWWNGAIAVSGEGGHPHVSPLIKYLPLGVVALAVAIASVFYLKSLDMAATAARVLKPLYLCSYHKWFFDELYDWLVVRPTGWLSRALWQKGDVRGIDRLGPNGAAWVSVRLGGALRLWQTGYLYHYAFMLIVGVCLLVTWLMI